MGDWITVPSFVTDGLAHIDVFQDIWENLYQLKNLDYAEKAFDGFSGGYSNATSTFADVDNTNIRLEFESFGGDILAGVQIKQNNSNSNGGAKVRFELDGVGAGGTNGLMNIQNIALQGFNQCQLLYIFKNVAAGDHILDLQFAVGASNAGTTSLYLSPGTHYKLWKLELN